MASRIFVPEPAAASFRLEALALALQDDGADVTVLTTRAPDGATPDVPGVDVRRWPVLRDPTGYVRGYVQYLSFDVPLFLRLLLARRPDVVVAEPPPTTGAVVALAGIVRRFPYVYYAADIWSDAAGASAPRPVVAALRAVERLVLRRAAAVLAVSPEVGERVQELGARRVSVVPNGIDTRVFAAEGAAPAPAAGRYFLYAGTASEWQGAEVFASAMRRVYARHPDVRLVYLGQGSSWERIREIARTLPDGVVRMHDRVSPAEAAAWLLGAVASLVSIRPGLGYDLARPTKVFAALAVGCPVVYAGPGPLRDVVDQGFGWTTKHDEEAVAEAMLRALDGPRPDPASARRWVEEHASLRATGERAADSVLGVARRLTL
ncbi:glycosyltransferase family 4 protein [Georgenia sp. EYE_87]|nr:glycosyltransferase family 4 protein [Georgenia sp. EYE_87]